MTTIRLLHIDDEPDIREIVALSLNLDPDFAVRSCASGQEGLAAAEEEQPDIILLDVMMPSMDGPTTLVRLREGPKTAAIPVIFMTARAQSREIDSFKALGAAAIIGKPFDPMTLAGLVRGHIPPIDDTLALSRAAFLRRASKDAEVLLECWSALQEQKSPTEVVTRIGNIAHGLSAVGDIVGLSRISEAAANLEDASIATLRGESAPRKIERALELLLTNIATHASGQIDQLRSKRGALERNRALRLD